MNKFWKVLGKTTAITVGILLGFMLIFTWGGVSYMKHKHPIFKQAYIIEVTYKRDKEVYYGSTYFYNDKSNSMVIINYKGNAVVHIYMNENVFVKIEPNPDFEPEVVIKEIDKTLSQKSI